VTAAGIFLTHHRYPRVRRHFERLVRESGHLVTWHFVYSGDTGARPRAPFAYPDPARVLPGRYRAMLLNGGVYGGFLDALFVPVLTALPADHLWLIEYDVDYAGSWDDLFSEFRDNDADLLTTTLMYKSEHPQWPHWKTAGTPSWVREDQLVRALNPLMRVSRRLLGTYAVAMADEHWRGTYEFLLSTVAVVSGARVEDLGNQGSFTPPERHLRIYTGKSPLGQPDDMTFRFRPARPRYFHEAPETFEKLNMVYHPVKPPGVRVWSQDGSILTRSKS
jgi:hypothetical protein